MINKKKVIALFLFAALIMTIIPANLNVPSIGATDGNPATITFNSNVTMEFGNHNNATWVSKGIDYLYFKNTTAGANITEIRNGSVFQWVEMVDYGQPAADTWWYITGPTLWDYYEIYTDWIAIHINESAGAEGGKQFTVDEVWSYWYLKPLEVYTIGSLGGYGIPPGGVAMIEGEQCLDIFDTDVTYMSYSYAGSVRPLADTWWSITYSGTGVSEYGTQFHISTVAEYWMDDTIEIGAWYDYVTIDEIRNSTGTIDNITLRPDEGPSADGLDADQWIGKIKPDTMYYISVDESYESLLPEAGSVWNITGPDELDTYQFNISKSEVRDENNFLWIDQLWNATADDISTVTLTNIVEYVEAQWAEAPKVAEIGSWYKVTDGATPLPQSWWNVTDAGLADVEFYVDMAGEGVFHIDEVRNATGVYESIPISPVDSLTAEELTSTLYVYPANTIGTKYAIDETFDISIKTNYNMNIWGYEFTLAYNPSVLNATAVTNGDLIAGTDTTFFEAGVDYVAGEVLLTGAKFDYLTNKTAGPGTLANVTFTVVGTGDSFITLGSRVIKITNGVQQNIVDDHTGQIVNGYFRNTAAEVVHDISLTDADIQFYYGKTDGYPSWTMNVDLDVFNKGTLNETYEAKIYQDFIGANWLLNGQSVEDHENLTYRYPVIICPLTTVYPGNHTMKVKAIISYGIEDANLTDNIYNVLLVHIRIPGDIGDKDNVGIFDNKVDRFDFGYFADAYGSKVGDGDWEPWCDFGEEYPRDGKCNFYDFSTFGDHFGEEIV